MTNLGIGLTEKRNTTWSESFECLDERFSFLASFSIDDIHTFRVSYVIEIHPIREHLRVEVQIRKAFNIRSVGLKYKFCVSMNKTGNETGE